MNRYKVALLASIMMFAGCSNTGVMVEGKGKSCTASSKSQQVWETQQKTAYIRKHTSSESFRDIAVDRYGNSYVIQRSRHELGRGFVKYNCHWEKVWEKNMGGSHSHKYIQGIGNNGNYIYIVGKGDTDVSGSLKSYKYIAKYDLNGKEIWTKKYRLGNNEMLNNNTLLSDMSVDKNGDIYLLNNTVTLEGGFLSKFNDKGKRIWNKFIKSRSLNALAVGRQGIYVAGETQKETLLVKYDKQQGNRIWRKRIKTIGKGGGDLFKSVDVGSDENIYVLGNTYYAIGHLLKFSPSGRKIWQKRTPVTSSVMSGGSEIFCAFDGKIYVAGQKIRPKQDNGFGRNLILVAFDREGNILKADIPSTSGRKSKHDTLVHKYSFYQAYKQKNSRFYIVQKKKVVYDALKYVKINRKTSKGDELVTIDAKNKIQKLFIKSDEVQTDLSLGMPGGLICGNGIVTYRAKVDDRGDKLEITIEDITEYEEKSDKKPKGGQKAASVPKSKADRLFFQNHKSTITYDSGDWYSKKIKLNSDYLFFQKGNKYGFLGEIAEIYKKNKPSKYYLKKSKNKKLYEKMEVVDENYLLLKRNGLYGYYKRTKIIYKSLGKYVDDLARFELPDERKGYVDTEGNEYFD